MKFVKLALSIGLYGSLFATRAVHAEPPSPTTRSDEGFLEGDDVRNRALDKAASDLMAAGGFVPMKTLRDQFSNGSTILKLPAQTDSPILSSQEIYKRTYPSVMTIGKVYGDNGKNGWHLGIACGYIIDPSGILVTCFHVVDQKPEEAKTLAAVDYDGKIYPVREIIACNRAYDIAIVKIDGGKFPAVPLADHADVGTPAFTIGHPGRRFYTYTSGIVTRSFESYWANAMIPMISISSEFGQGSSGGPVFDDHGRLIGMISRTSPINAMNDNGRVMYPQMIERRCVPVQSIRDLLSGKPGPTTVPTTAPATNESH